MKRMAIMMTAAALACTVGALGVGAAGRNRAGGARCTAPRCHYAAQTGAGAWACGTGGCRYDTDGDGLCDRESCGGFVDENGDGICDNRPAAGRGGHHARWTVQP